MRVVETKHSYTDVEKSTNFVRPAKISDYNGELLVGIVVTLFFLTFCWVNIMFPRQTLGQTDMSGGKKSSDPNSMTNITKYI